ncbi:hypothetical protein [Streptomyces sp. NPDC058629]|uniref:hypothetical protein n=1 Tax=Streptomyces sp. NPDC058629 TaxID=3346565 RepID=UPI00365EDEDA
MPRRHFTGRIAAAAVLASAAVLGSAAVPAVAAAPAAVLACNGLDINASVGSACLTTAGQTTSVSGEVTITNRTRSTILINATRDSGTGSLRNAIAEAKAGDFVTFGSQVGTSSTKITLLSQNVVLPIGTQIVPLSELDAALN